jgi:hypothetical protein
MEDPKQDSAYTTQSKCLGGLQGGSRKPTLSPSVVIYCHTLVTHCCHLVVTQLSLSPLFAQSHTHTPCRVVSSTHPVLFPLLLSYLPSCKLSVILTTASLGLPELEGGSPPYALTRPSPLYLALVLSLLVAGQGSSGCPRFYPSSLLGGTGQTEGPLYPGLSLLLAPLVFPASAHPRDAMPNLMSSRPAVPPQVSSEVTQCLPGFLHVPRPPQDSLPREENVTDPFVGQY